MIRFSILLIDNQIPVTAQVITGIGQHLTEYTLTVTKEMAEAVTHSRQPQVILINLDLLAANVNDQWAELKAAFPGIPVLVLVSQPVIHSNIQTKVLDILSLGAEDYYDLSAAGLFALGRRLAALQNKAPSITSVPDTKRQIDTRQLRYNEQLQILLQASRGMSDQLELEPTLKKVVNQTQLLLAGENCQIYFLEKDNKTLRPVLAAGPLAEQIQTISLTIGQGVLGKVAARGKATLIATVKPDIEVPYAPDVSLLGAPLTAVGGTIGLIVVSRQTPYFAKDDLYLFEILTQQASSAINNARLFEETTRSLNELATLYEVSMAISTHWEDQDVLNTLIEKAVKAIDADRGLVASWHTNQNKGLIEAHFPTKAEEEITLHFSPVIELAGRTNVLGMLNQQRPLFFNIDSPSLETAERNRMQRAGCLSKLLIPLVTQGQTIGWVELWNTRQHRTFTPDEVRLSRALASQIAVALQNNQYLKQTRRTLEETTALYRVASELTSLQDPQAIMSTVLQEYLQALSLRQGSVIMFDFINKCGIVKVRIQDEMPATQLTASGERPKKPTYKISEGQEISLQNNPVYQQLMRTHQPVIIDAISGGPSGEKPDLSTNQWAGSRAFTTLVIPINISDEVVGVLVAENTRNAFPFDRAAISLGQAMAEQLGIGLQNVELYESEYLRREQAETLRQVSSIVGSSLKLNEVLELILDQLARVIKYDSAAIHLVQGKHRRVIAGRGFKNPEDHIGLVFPIEPDNNEPGSIAIYTKQPLVYNDISEVNESFRETRHQHIRSWIGIPLIARDKVIGLISIDHKEIGAYTEDDVNLAQAFANQVAIALENARLYALEIDEIERELDFAQEIQETLLPQFIPQIPGLDIAGRIVPARQVGGDFFHFFSTDPEQLGVAIGDVSGKGIPAALYMAAGITAIDTQTGPDVMPGELLNKLNSKLYNRLQENRMNIALQVATFIPLPHPNNITDKARGSIMTVASAGMIAPIGATEYGCRLLPVSGLPIGMLPSPQQEYVDEVFLLDPFTTIIFSSDGIVEAQNTRGELFGFERLQKTILEVISTHEAALIAEHIVDSAQEFMGKAEQHDDMTVVVVVKK